MSDHTPTATREYSIDELAAFRVVTRHEWTGAGDSVERGPAQFAAGDYWPAELLKKADQLEARASLYRVAAIALRREIAADPLCNPIEGATA